MTYPGPVSNAPEWVELDFDGVLRGRWKLPQSMVGQWAFSSDGRLFAMVDGALVVLDKTTSTWKPEGASSTGHNFLLGADERQLVFEEPSTRGIQLRWIQPN
jgi:hypothetical protein